jgi:hypothetical protein
MVLVLVSGEIEEGGNGTVGVLRGKVRGKRGAGGGQGVAAAEEEGRREDRVHQRLIVVTPVLFQRLELA